MSLSSHLPGYHYVTGCRVGKTLGVLIICLPEESTFDNSLGPQCLVWFLAHSKSSVNASQLICDFQKRGLSPSVCRLLGGRAPVCPRSSPANLPPTIHTGHIKMSKPTVPLASTLPGARNVRNQVILQFYWVVMTSSLLIPDSSWHFVRKLEWANSQKRVLIRILADVRKFLSQAASQSP